MDEMKIGRTMFPYAMQKNPDGKWTLLNRNYKPLGVVDKAWATYDDERHKLTIKHAVIRKLTKMAGETPPHDSSERIYFFEDATAPWRNAENMRRYLEIVSVLLKA